jgi:hypothetical protein
VAEVWLGHRFGARVSAADALADRLLQQPSRLRVLIEQVKALR